MAQKIQVLLTCDLESGDKPGTETIAFAVEGKTYEIDLCTKHAKQLRDAVAPFIEAGRRTGSRGAGSGRSRSSGGGDRERTQAIRAWARRKGIKVSERGRLSGDIVAKYEASGGK
jgi:hypothetical protein